MTNFAKFKIMTADELADFLDEFGQFDGAPWTEWFGHNYCDKCESINVNMLIQKKSLEFPLFFIAAK
jgi:hypothetical protein